MAATYGWALSVLRSSPDLSALFDRAVAGTYGQARFVAELRNTKWYKSHSESMRQTLVLQKADPREYQRRITQAGQAFSDQYFAMTGKKIDPTRAQKYGASILYYGFNDVEVRDLVGGTVKGQTLMKGGLGGTLGEAERQIRTAAEDYGLDFSDTYIAGKINDIARQKTDTTSVVNNFRQQAKSKYLAYSDQIDQGATIKDIAEPYRQVMAKTFEISDAGITTNDKNIQRALMFRPTVGKKVQAPAPLNLADFERELKNDPRWNRTKGAQDSIMAAGRQVLQDMGFQGTGGN